MKCNDRYVNLQDERKLESIACFQLRQSAAKAQADAGASESITEVQSINYADLEIPQ
ncbi:hypothetical protein [Pontibacter kalidii]|uniref:hypothetical protein n=1 Tax=Pontibacter kalidii TaxID=2592049 RepID=UPI002252C3D3|nr:hypothetical protein [Pontibacter kalidii]